MNVRVSKLGTSAAETFVVKNAAGTEVLSYTSGSSGPQTACLPTGIYTVEMSDNTGALWADGSFVNIEAEVAGSYVMLAKGRLNKSPSDSFQFAVNYPVANAAASTSMKYLMGTTIPSGWTTTSFTESGWTTLSDSSRPTTSANIVLFRNAFSLSDKAGYHGVELRVKARWGVIAYLNGQEVYRVHVSPGDLTPSSTNVGGSSTTDWRSIVVPMSAVQTGNNMLAVAIVNAQSSITLDFDMTLRLMASSKSFPRYWDSTATYSSLFDQQRGTRLYEVVPATSYDVVLTLSDDRAEAYNKYCFVTNWDALRHDPREWKVYGSKDGVDYVELDHQQEVYFDERLTSNCFYMLNNNVAYSYYKLSLIKPRVDEAGNHYALCQWNLYLEDFSQAVVPELSMEPATQVGYTDAEFPKAVVSSLYYHSFTISPALPSGLRLSPLDGSISGVLSSPLAATTYQLSAVNHLGETKTTSITVSVEVCSNDKIAFTLEFVMEGGGDACSFELKDLSNDEIVASRTKFANWNTLSLPMCQHATTYGLILKKTDYGGWGSNYVNVKLVDGTLLLKESLAAGSAEKEYQFNPAYAVAPKWTTWSYLYDDSAPEGWNTLSGAPASWATAMTVDLPAGNGITQYYYTKFTTTSVSAFATMDIAVNVRGGAVIYLNGQEVRRINMPQGTITSTTLASNLFTESRKVVTGEFVQGGRLQKGENILAVEMHRYEAGTEVNTFDVSAIMIMDNMYVITEGTGSSYPVKTGSEGVNSVFDNNSNTKFFYLNGVVGTWWQWTYNNDRRTIANNYGVVCGNDCNNRHPSGWKVYGSNDGSNWDMLDEQTGQAFTQPKQQMRYDMANVKAYNMYRLEVTELNNALFSSDSGMCYTYPGVQLADFYLFAKRIPAVCPAKDGYESTTSGKTSSIPCEEGYAGTIVRYCNADGEWEDPIRNCVPGAPKSIKYDVQALNLVAKKKMDPVTPTIVGLEVTVSSFPKLPEGLNLDAATGTISGTPKAEQETRPYIISVTNASGESVSTTLNITIDKPAVNWLLIIIIVVVVVIVVAVVVVVVLSSRKKGSKSKSIPKSATKPKNAAKPAAQPKVAVKV